MTTSMRALRQTSLAGPSALQLVDVPVPTAGPGELLIRVAAAGINFADISRGRGTFAGGPTAPFIAGFEAAGEVDGRHVVGVGTGAFAEYMVLPAAAAMPVPPGWTPAQALGLAVNAPTALAALRLARVAAGETVAIHAAAGATGQAAIRIAKHLGATVVAIASPEKHAVARACGADRVVDARSDRLADDVRACTDGGADVTLCTGALAASLAAARGVTGRVVVYGVTDAAAVSTWELVYAHPVQIIGFNLGALFHSGRAGEIVGELGALIAAGVIPPTAPTTYPLADGAAALAALESRATVGKLALLP